MDCCRRRVEGLYGGIARCMVRCYSDRAIYGWGLPTQGCEFLEIERGSLGAGSKAINKHASKQTELSPNPLAVPSGVAKLCALEFHLVRARMCGAYATRLGSIHLPVGTRDGRAQRGLKEPGVGSDRTNGLQENRLIPELPGDI
ncbi:hypothetical protein CRG98_021469 [Punica granatum]|uniref:Uncharacterized protein n=1 Tax=Punica granatum TaxID=22663 RepID=A0A2I0JPB6_PUNGR|nr:hypothetical protein CRG98_021469 [Punica granatum]